MNKVNTLGIIISTSFAFYGIWYYYVCPIIKQNEKKKQISSRREQITEILNSQDGSGNEADYALLRRLLGALGDEPFRSFDELYQALENTSLMIDNDSLNIVDRTNNSNSNNIVDRTNNSNSNNIVDRTNNSNSNNIVDRTNNSNSNNIVDRTNNSNSNNIVDRTNNSNRNNRNNVNNVRSITISDDIDIVDRHISNRNNRNNVNNVRSITISDDIDIVDRHISNRNNANTSNFRNNSNIGNNRNTINNVPVENIVILDPDIEKLRLAQEEEKRGHKKNCFEIIHFGIGCNNCNQLPIYGYRYHCLTCSDFDLCANCNMIRDVHPSSHLLVQIKVSVPRFKQTLYNINEGLLSNSTTGIYPENKKISCLLPKKLSCCQLNTIYDFFNNRIPKYLIEARYYHFRCLVNKAISNDTWKLNAGFDLSIFKLFVNPPVPEINDNSIYYSKESYKYALSENQNLSNFISERLFLLYDQNKDGIISFKEYLIGINLLGPIEKNVKCSHSYGPMIFPNIPTLDLFFNVLDQDNDGYINGNDIKDILIALSQYSRFSLASLLNEVNLSSFKYDEIVDKSIPFIKVFHAIPEEDVTDKGEAIDDAQHGYINHGNIPLSSSCIFSSAIINNPAFSNNSIVSMSSNNNVPSNSYSDVQMESNESNDLEFETFAWNKKKSPMFEEVDENSSSSDDIVKSNKCKNNIFDNKSNSRDKDSLKAEYLKHRPADFNTWGKVCLGNDENTISAISHLNSIVDIHVNNLTKSAFASLGISLSDRMNKTAFLEFGMKTNIEIVDLMRALNDNLSKYGACF